MSNLRSKTRLDFTEGEVEDAVVVVYDDLIEGHHQAQLDEYQAFMCYGNPALSES